MTFYGDSLPDFPWDTLNEAKRVAYSYSGVVADLSIGTPVDPTPDVAIAALTEHAQAPGYPTVVGTPSLRPAIANWWLRERHATVAPSGILPTLGSKEMVAQLPSLLGLSAPDVVLVPERAYPTYEVGAKLAGAWVSTFDPESDPASWPAAALVWLNSPGNPDGHVLSREQLRKIVRWARAAGTIVASDECYAALPWSEPWVREGVPSILSDDVSDADHNGLLALYSLSKQSNLAGYRAAFLSGDPAIVADILEIRKHAGFMVPGPVQHVMEAVLNDSEHVRAQREVYGTRRKLLVDAVTAAGLAPDPLTGAGLYLWLRDATGHASSDSIVNALAERGILTAPGHFYGPAAEGYVRMSLTGSDEAIAAAAERLHAEPLTFERFPENARANDGGADRHNPPGEFTVRGDDDGVSP